jgi:isoquinoline 1-oxidoreductase subunit beta
MNMSRRTFLVSSGAAAAGGALVVGFHLYGHGDGATPSHPDPLESWIELRPDGKAVLTLEKCEMGQGVYTGLPRILAEEAELDWSSVIVRQSLRSTGTGGSGSTSDGYLLLRRAGAVVREAMLGAAAHKWRVSKESCIARQSIVTHSASGRTLPYKELVSIARELPLPTPDHVPLKDPSQFRLIGKVTPALDIPAKVMGDACFGLDVRPPGMVFAVVARCPTFGGKVATYDARKALLVPGVLQVFEIEPRPIPVGTAGGVVVVARTTWAAFEGRKALNITWDDGPHRDESTKALSASLHEALARQAKIVRDDGDVEHALRTAVRRVEATYEFPFLAHAPMEPMNTTVHLQGATCEVWCPSQSPDWARSAIAKELGFNEADVTVHATFMGGGFGRRFVADYPVEAAQIARHVSRPVQLVWSREDDMAQSLYRPACCHQFKGALNHDGKVVAWSNSIASTSIRVYWDPPKKVKPESQEIGGAVNFAYPVPAVRVAYTPVASGVPRMWWRSVENSFNGFAVECFMDELAVAARRDPYAFRRSHLTGSAASVRRKGADLNRLVAVLDLAAQKSGWKNPRGRQRGRGIACGTAYGYLAMVAEVTVEAHNIKVDRVIAAVDCGQIVNPDGARQQIEGGIIFALSAALKGEITIADGRVQQSNFNGYDVVRMPESPAIEVYFVENHEAPSGLGEAAVPLLAPAVANAVFDATGRRLRKLPLRLEEVPV